MFRKKSILGLRSSPPLEQAPFPPPPLTSNSSFSAPTFDRFMASESGNHLVLAPDSRDALQERNGRVVGEELSTKQDKKKSRAFPWVKQKATQAGNSNATTTGHATTTTAPATPIQSTQSLPLAFPPSPIEEPLRQSTLLAFPAPPNQHAVSTAFNAPAAGPPNPPNKTLASDSLSTFNSTSSFASSSLFTNTTDEWESSSSLSLTSSPESKSSSSLTSEPRMWRVKGLSSTSTSSPAILNTNPPPTPPRDIRRNSTPIPRMVAMMLGVDDSPASPETPPRLKRFSTSSLQTGSTHASPPFNPLFERAVQASPESSRDADDEVSPKRGEAAGVLSKKAKRRSTVGLGMSGSSSSGSEGGGFLFPSDEVYSSKRESRELSRTRIPSIRFEGISMDAVFAEVEKKMASESGGAAMSGGAGQEEADKKAARRRTRVISMYRAPLAYGDEDAGSTTPSLSTSSSTACSTLSPSSSDLEQLRAGSVTPTQALPLPLDVPRPRPYPRRTSSRRPAPLDVNAANSLPTFRYSATPTTAVAMSSPISPPLCGAFSPVPNRAPPVEYVLSPAQSTFDSLSTPTRSTFSSFASPSSPTPSQLGEPFMPSPSLQTTPTLASASAFAPSPEIYMPEICVFPPTPNLGMDDSSASDDEVDSDEATTPAAPTNNSTRFSSHPTTTATTKVVLVEPKRLIRSSTRGAPPPSASRRPSFVPVSVPTSIVAPPQPPPIITSLPTSRYTITTPPRTPSPSSYPSSPVGSSSLEDSPNVDPLNRMLLALNRPHTPPRHPSFSHHRATSSISSSASDSDGSSRFSDAPLRISIPQLHHARKPHSASIDAMGGRVLPNEDGTRPAVFVSAPSEASLVGLGMSSGEEDGEEQEEEEEELDLIELAIESTIASLESASSSSSTISSTDTGSSSMRRSRTHSSDLSTSSSRDSLASCTDSEASYASDDVAEVGGAVVMMGQRVSCAYDVGVIGVAM